MNEFAKIFNSEKYGQLLCVNDDNDNGDPSIQISFNCVKGLGVNSIGLVFKSYNGCDKAFNKLTIEFAENAVANTINLLQKEYGIE